MLLPFMVLPSISPQPLQARSSLGKDRRYSHSAASAVEAFFLLSCLQKNRTAVCHIGTILKSCHFLISLPFLGSISHISLSFCLGPIFITFYSFNFFNQSLWDSFQILYRCFQGLELELISTLIKACPVLSLKGGCLVLPISHMLKRLLYKAWFFNCSVASLACI